MNQENKIFIGIGLITFLIIACGIFLFGKSGPQVAGAATVDQGILLRNSHNSIRVQKVKVTLVEFADFQCPACGAAHPIVKQVLEKYKDKIMFVYRHFPLQQHRNARLAARAAEAAGAQSRFWEMYDVLYEKQTEWGESTDAKQLFISYAKMLELDSTIFTKALESDKFDQSIQQDYSDGVTLGVNSTPNFFLNGKKLQLRSLADLPQLVEQEVQ